MTAMTKGARWLALLPQDYIERLVAAQGRLEDGCTANPKTLRMNDATHVRIVGENRTLCGVKLTPDFSTRWQFYSRGTFGETLPHSIHADIEGTRPGSYPPCKHCAAHPVVTLTLDAQRAARTALDREFEAARKKRDRLDRQRDARRRAREAARA